MAALTRPATAACRVALVVVTASFYGTPIDAQLTGPDIPAASVVTSAPQLALRSTDSRSTDVAIRWTLEGPPAAVPVPRNSLARVASTFDVVSSVTVSAPMVRERDPQLAVDHLLVMAIGPGGDQLGWQLVRDPRLVRAELPNADNTLSGQVLYRPTSEFFVSLPTDLSIAGLHIYEVAWTGQAFVLRELGTVDLR